MNPGGAAEDHADPGRLARRARRQRLKAAHPDTGGSAQAFRELLEQLTAHDHDAPLRVVVRPDRSGVLGVVDDLVRHVQASRRRRRRSRVD